jgi:hypothetical protein
VTDKERITEILKAYTKKHNISASVVILEEYAEELLANGVIVQKQGEWETTQEPLGWNDVECVECSACHESWICDEENDFEFYKEFWKYCPSCGARMVKGA